MRTWQLLDAKGRSSEVVENAQAGEAQVVTTHGKEVAVVLDDETYLGLAGIQRSALEGFGDIPAGGLLTLGRDRTPVHAVELE